VLQGQQYTIDDQILAIESAENASSVFETLSIASETSREILKKNV